MDSYQIFEAVIKAEGKSIFNWNKLLNELKDTKEK